MNEPGIDFSSLDPTRDPRRLDSIAQRIAADAMRARATRGDLFAELASFTRPALAAAAVIALVTIPALATLHPTPPSVAAQAQSSNVLGIPDRVVALLRSPETPSVADLADALGTPGGSNGR